MVRLISAMGLFRATISTDFGQMSRILRLLSRVRYRITKRTIAPSIAAPPRSSCLKISVATDIDRRMWSLDPSWQVSAPSEGAIFPLLSLHKTRGKERITKNDYSTLINGNHAPISSCNDHIGRCEALEVVGDPIVVSIGTLTLPGFALLRRVKMQECPL